MLFEYVCANSTHRGHASCKHKEEAQRKQQASIRQDGVLIVVVQEEIVPACTRTSRVDTGPKTCGGWGLIVCIYVCIDGFCMYICI
jgi:hypothetical protein